MGATQAGRALSPEGLIPTPPGQREGAPGRAGPTMSFLGCSDQLFRLVSARVFGQTLTWPQLHAVSAKSATDCGCDPLQRRAPQPLCCVSANVRERGRAAARAQADALPLFDGRAPPRRGFGEGLVPGFAQAARVRGRNITTFSPSQVGLQVTSGCCSPPLFEACSCPWLAA